MHVLSDKRIINIIYFISSMFFLLGTDAHAENKILILTDQINAERATKVSAEIQQTQPFSLMGTRVEILKVTNKKMWPYCRKVRDRGIICDQENSNLEKFANDKRLSAGASVVLLIVEYSERLGASSAGDVNLPAVMTTEAEAEVGVHEIMHTLGFSDEYNYTDVSDEEELPCSWGYNKEIADSGGVSGCSTTATFATIMGTSKTGCIPESYWPYIARGLGVRTPTARGATQCYVPN